MAKKAKKRHAPGSGCQPPTACRARRSAGRIELVEGHAVGGAVAGFGHRVVPAGALLPAGRGPPGIAGRARGSGAADLARAVQSGAIKVEMTLNPELPQVRVFRYSSHQKGNRRVDQTLRGPTRFLRGDTTATALTGYVPTNTSPVLPERAPRSPMPRRSWPQSRMADTELARCGTGAIATTRGSALDA